MNTPAAARESQEAGFAQPSLHHFLHVCMYDENIKSRVGGDCDVGLARQLDYRRCACCDRETESRLVSLTFSLHPLPTAPSLASNQREAREGYGLIKFTFLPCASFPSCFLIFLISQIASLYSLILELLSQVRPGRKLLIYKTSLVNTVWLKETVVEFVPLVGRKLLRQAGQSHTDLVV